MMAQALEMAQALDCSRFMKSLQVRSTETGQESYHIGVRKMNQRERLLGALIGLARTCNMHEKTEHTTGLILYALMAADPFSGLSEEEFHQLIDQIHAEKKRIAPGCATCMAKCGNTDDYDLTKNLQDPAEVQKLKKEIEKKLCRNALLFADVYGTEEWTDEIESFFYRALCAISYDMDVERYQMIIKQEIG